MLQIVNDVVTGPHPAINLLGGTIYLAGTLLLGVAVWRCGALPRWIGVFLALHGALRVFGFAILWGSCWAGCSSSSVVDGSVGRLGGRHHCESGPGCPAAKRLTIGLPHDIIFV